MERLLEEMAVFVGPEKAEHAVRRLRKAKLFVFILWMIGGDEGFVILVPSRKRFESAFKGMLVHEM